MTTRDVMDLMNDAFRADPDALQRLIDTRVPCNEKLAEHPNIQVRASEGNYLVGMLGIINGILGKIGQPPLAAMYENNKVVGFLQGVPQQCSPSSSGSS